jgi:hypothetical protein
MLIRGTIVRKLLKKFILSKKTVIQIVKVKATMLFRTKKKKIETIFFEQSQPEAQKMYHNSLF